MSKFLPTGGFKWIKEDDSPAEEHKSVQEWVKFIKKQKNEQDNGYFLKLILNIQKNSMIPVIHPPVHQNI